MARWAGHSAGCSGLGCGCGVEARPTCGGRGASSASNSCGLRVVSVPSIASRLVPECFLEVAGRWEAASPGGLPSRCAPAGPPQPLSKSCSDMLVPGHPLLSCPRPRPQLPSPLHSWALVYMRLTRRPVHVPNRVWFLPPFLIKSGASLRVSPSVRRAGVKGWFPTSFPDDLEQAASRAGLALLLCELGRLVAGLCEVSVTLLLPCGEKRPRVFRVLPAEAVRQCWGERALRLERQGQP